MVGAIIGNCQTLPRGGLSGCTVVDLWPHAAEFGREKHLPARLIAEGKSGSNWDPSETKSGCVRSLEGIKIFDKAINTEHLFGYFPLRKMLSEVLFHDKQEIFKFLPWHPNSSRLGHDPTHFLCNVVRLGREVRFNWAFLWINARNENETHIAVGHGRWRLTDISENKADTQSPILILAFNVHIVRLWRLANIRRHPCPLGSYDMVRLSPEYAEGDKSEDNKQDASAPGDSVIPGPRFRHGSRIGDVYGGILAPGIFILSCAFAWLTGGALCDGKTGLAWIFGILSAICLFLTLGMGLIGCLPWNWPRCLCDGEDHSENRQSFPHNSVIVQQKLLTRDDFRYTVIIRGLDMANTLSTDKQIAVIGALAEGSSIRSIERITGVHRDTIMRLGVKVGQGCTALMDEKMRNLPCRRLEMDEIWGFVGKKEKHVKPEDGSEVGSVWTFCAIDAETKLVPAFRVGNRDAATANAFLQDVAERMAYRVQISTDGLKAYVEAIENAFGGDADYAQIIKTYGFEETGNNRRYSAPEFVSSEKKIIAGRPNMDLISTSYIERLNATTRLHMRRLTRLTLAFSKKRENFEAAVGLHFAYYNFVKRHNTLRCSPAMAAGVTGSFWSVGDLLEATA